MNLIETIASLAVMTLFFSGLCQIAIPVIHSIGESYEAYENARSIAFIDESFRAECALKKPNIERWKKNISVVGGLESCVVTPCFADERVCAMRAVCAISSKRIEILAEVSHE
jgi:hypothetical protein